jgi:tetratricopeptide (TPR) repeat protein
MKNIALRAFQRNIEENIIRKDITAAVCSCRAIFEVFPKNLETYRLLGKAFLEDSRLELVDKVFNIILRIDPDDFVSHIGKSFVAEAKSDLSHAVESMERAFELQPANEMLQQEVKRLLKLKNGVEPKKVRLTRGSLIKMYLRGKLYQQASSEIRIGIHENPNRLDFKINLAECLFNLDKPIQAVETCVSIIAELPYCWKANEIIDQVISGDSDNKNGNMSRSRLVEMDPYYEYMLPTTATVYDVPDIAVMFNADSVKNADEVDWDSFLKDIWAINISEPPIVEKINSEIVAKDIVEQEAEISSKKGRFLSKLRSSSSENKNQKEIPDWIFDEKPESETEFVKEIIIPPVETTSEESVSIAEEIPENNQSAEAAENPVEDINSHGYHKEWRSEETTSEDSSFNGGAISLDDTQRISTDFSNFENLILEAQKAVVGENVQHSLTIFRNLLSDKSNLEKVIPILNSVVNENPDLSDFKLLLGEAFLKTGQKEKANRLFLEVRENRSE